VSSATRRKSRQFWGGPGSSSPPFGTTTQALVRRSPLVESRGPPLSWRVAAASDATSALAGNVEGRAAIAAELNTGEMPTASENCRQVVIEATTTRASTVIRSMPTRKSRTHASMTIPLSRTRSKTSIGLLPPEARSMLIAIPFRARPELHGHAAVSSSRRSRPPMCSMILHQVSKLIGLVRSASIRRCTDDTAEGDQRKTGKTFPISAWIQRWRDRVVSTGPRCRRGARSLRRGRTLRSPPVLVYKPCHHLRCGQKIAQPKADFA